VLHSQRRKHGHYGRALTLRNVRAVLLNHYNALDAELERFHKHFNCDVTFFVRKSSFTAAGLTTVENYY